MQDKIISTALSQWNETGIIGTKSNPEILAYFEASGFPNIQDDDIAWCAAFVNWVLAKCGIQGTEKLLARSFLNWGKKTETPQVGDIVVLWRISPDSIYGHVGFYVSETVSSVYILGGNQADSVNITP